MEDKPGRLVKNVSANREGTCHCESRRRRSNLYFQLGTAFPVNYPIESRQPLLDRVENNGLKVVLVEDSTARQEGSGSQTAEDIDVGNVVQRAATRQHPRHRSFATAS